MLGTTTCGSQSRLKFWEPQLVVPFQDQNVGNHNLKPQNISILKIQQLFNEYKGEEKNSLLHL